MSMDAIAEMLEKARVADGQSLSDNRLKEVFDLVRAPGNWKDPIAATVPKTEASAVEIEVAVTWYAGGVPEVFDRGDHWYVTGAGYYEWIGA